MPTIYLPGPLVNICGSLATHLPVLEGPDFFAAFRARVFQVPHPEQPPGDDGGDDYIPCEEGETHLDLVYHWFALGVLADPDFGLRHLARPGEGRDAADTTAGLLRRWLAGDPPAAEEWEAVIEGPELGNVAMAASCWASAEAGAYLLIDTHITEAVRAWVGHRVPAPWNRPAVPMSLGRRLKAFILGTTIVPLARMALRRPHAGGNLHAYRAQANWLRRLLALRWLPTDPDEAALLAPLSRGRLDGLTRYADCLKAADVPFTEVAEMTDTLRRMARLMAGEGGRS